MAQKIIGVDIGSYSVKVALVERGLKSFSFTEFYERKIQYNELLSPDESVAIAIQGLIDDHNLAWDIVCAGFPAQRVTSRLLTFPFSSSKKIDQTVQFEIESYIPFNVDDVVIDYTVVWQTKDVSRVMVVYVQKRDLAKELTMLGTVGVDPRFVTVEGVDLSNLVNIGMVPPEGAYAIIDAGHEKSTVTICKGKRLGYIRAISTGGKAITQAIANRLSVPFDEAERMKIEMGRLPFAEDLRSADEITRNVTEAIRGVMDELLLHLRQTFFSYRETEDVPIEGVYLCGGTSRLPGFDRYISDALKLNVTYLNCSEFHFSRLDHADAHRHVIPGALALALGGATSGPELNLRRGDFAFKGNVEQFGGSLRRVGVVIGLIIFLALINFTAKYYSVTRQIEKLKSDIVTVVRQALPATREKDVETPAAAIKYIKQRENEIDERANQLKGISSASPLDALRDISAAVPPRDELKVEIIDIKITGDKIVLTAIVNDFKVMDTIKAALEKKGSPFTNVVATGDKVKDGVKIQMSMDRVLTAADQQAPAGPQAPSGQQMPAGQQMPSGQQAPAGEPQK